MVGQGLELFEIIDLLPDPFRRWGRDTLAELPASLEALQHEVRALGYRPSVLLLRENLAAEGAPPQAVNGLELGQKILSLGRELIDGFRHELYCILTDTISKAKITLYNKFRH